MPNKKVKELDKKTIILNTITNGFGDARIIGTEAGFKINTNKPLMNLQISHLTDFGKTYGCVVCIKRSGAGVVVIIDL